MSKYVLAVPLVLGLALSACSKTEAPEAQGGATTAAPVTAPVAEAKQRVRDTLEIGDGLVLPKGFAIRSRSVRGEGADATRVARVEFPGTADDAGEALRSSFMKAGLRQASVTNAVDGTVTRVFRSSDGERVRVVLIPKGPALQVELQDPAADGLATLYWR